MEATKSDKETSFDMHNTNNAYPSTFPVAFVEYCIQNALPPSLFQSISKLTDTLPRYVRVHRAWWDYFKQNADKCSTCEKLYSKLISEPEWEMLFTQNRINEAEKIRIMQIMLAEEFHLSVNEVKHVNWLPHRNCFALPAHVLLHSSHMYQLGFIIGMDAASMAAVLALEPKNGDVVLDICCAPGMKLNLIVDMIRGDANTTLVYSQKTLSFNKLEELQQIANAAESAAGTEKAKKVNTSSNNNNHGIVIGVDANLDRLYTCRSIIRKHENAYKNSLPKDMHNCNDNKSITSTYNENYATLLDLNVALFLADGCTFTLSKALQTLLVPSQQQNHYYVENNCKKQCAVLHGNTGLTSHEERKLIKLNISKANCKEIHTKSSSETMNSSKRERVSHNIKCNTSINNGHSAKCTLPVDKNVNTKVHVVYAPKSVRQELSNLYESFNALPSLSSYREQQLNETPEFLFDKVLVDAECTHDGSLRHLCLGLPYSKSRNAEDDNISLTDKQDEECTGVSNTHRMAHIHINNVNENATNAQISNRSQQDHIKVVKKEEQWENKEEEEVKKSSTLAIGNYKQNSKGNTTSDLFALQLGLLRNGFAQLKVNGTLVYCTCSFAYAQDENVVLHFIEEYNANNSESHLKAVLVPLFSFTHSANTANDESSDNCNNYHNTLTPFLNVYDALQCKLDSCKDYCNVVRDGAKLCKRFWADEISNKMENDNKCEEYKHEKINNDSSGNADVNEEDANRNHHQNMYAGSRF